MEGLADTDGGVRTGAPVCCIDVCGAGEPVEGPTAVPVDGGETVVCPCDVVAGGVEDMRVTASTTDPMSTSTAAIPAAVCHRKIVAPWMAVLL